MTTTASITHGFASIRRLTRCLDRLGLLAGVCLFLLALAGSARAESTDIAWMRVERDDGLRLSAQVRFELPAVIEDALTKGIPMSFVAEASVLRERWYWYDKEVTGATRYMRLSYQPLTRRWRLQVSSTPVGQDGVALGQSFETRDEALAALQRISGWKIASEEELGPDSRYYVTLRFRLDVSQLPRPFQIGVAGQNEWNIAASRSVRVGEGPR